MTSVVLFPSRFEASGLLHKLVQRRKIPAPIALWKGELGEHAVVVGIIGIGQQPARDASMAFLQWLAASAEPVHQVRLAGFAGALDPGLSRLAVCRDSDGGLYTADEVVATAQAKARLRADTGARLVDMEYAALAPLFAQQGLPLHWLRIISDDAAAELPADALARGVDPATGKPTPFRLLGYLARHPMDFPPLMEFICSLPEVREVLTRELIADLEKSWV